MRPQDGWLLGDRGVSFRAEQRLHDERHRERPDRDTATAQLRARNSVHVGSGQRGRWRCARVVTLTGSVAAARRGWREVAGDVASRFSDGACWVSSTSNGATSSSPVSTTVPETVARSTGHRKASLMIGMMIPRSK